MQDLEVSAVDGSLSLQVQHFYLSEGSEYLFRPPRTLNTEYGFGI